MTGVDAPHAGSPGLVTGGAAGIAARPALADRLTALARMTQIGSARSGHDGFSQELLAEAEQLLSRAGERLRMSAEHTVVVLAGGTGSGKSSLFNRLAGADFSPVGAIRPTTREAYACVWGAAGARPLLEWLGVRDRNRYDRSSALDEGERSLAGLLLLDLPDHDSVLRGQSGAVNRLLGLADLMVWVLDPQKYADAAVHSRYLVPMAGHSSVITVVLNQADLLTTEEADDCVADLRRLLDTEGLHDTKVLITSAVDGTGLDDLKEVLAATVSARHASSERIAADVDAIAARFAPYAGNPARPAVAGSPAVNGQEPASSVPQPTFLAPGAQESLAEAFSAAAGVPGVTSTLQSARELKAVDYVGWPVSWLVDRFVRHDAVRKIRLGTLWDEMREVTAGPAGAQQADIDNAISALAGAAGRDLPTPWPATVRTAARSQVAGIPRALGAAIAEVLPAENSVVPWWRVAAVWQGLLLGAAVAGLVWLGVLIAAGVFHAFRPAALLFSDASLIPWVAVMVAALLLVGWLTAIGCMTLAVGAAQRERDRAEQAMRAGVADVARRMVVRPVEEELLVCARFREEMAIACG